MATGAAKASDKAKPRSYATPALPRLSAPASTALPPCPPAQAWGLRRGFQPPTTWASSTWVSVLGGRECRSWSPQAQADALGVGGVGGCDFESQCVCMRARRLTRMAAVIRVRECGPTLVGRT